MKVYVAAKFEKKELVLDIHKRIKEMGCSVAYDWTAHKTIKPYSQNQDFARQYSENETSGIIDCDVFVYITDEKGNKRNNKNKTKFLKINKQKRR